MGASAVPQFGWAAPGFQATPRGDRQSAVSSPTSNNNNNNNTNHNGTSSSSKDATSANESNVSGPRRDRKAKKESASASASAVKKVGVGSDRRSWAIDVKSGHKYHNGVVTKLNA